jgi:hypothetical protein
MPLLVDGIKFNQTIKVVERKTGVGIGPAVSFVEHVFSIVQDYEQGTGANKIDCVYSNRNTALSGGAPLDLRGSLASVLDGSTVSFPIVVGVFVKNLSSTPGEFITIGGGSNPFISWLSATGDGVKVGPGGSFQLFSPIDGYATTAGTADILQLTEGAGTPGVEVMIVGRQS